MSKIFFLHFSDLQFPNNGRDRRGGEPIDERAFAVRRRRIIRVCQGRIKDDQGQAVPMGCGSR